LVFGDFQVITWNWEKRMKKVGEAMQHLPMSQAGAGAP
jgi:hypothetical protein